MQDIDVVPEIKEVVGAILFAAKQPVTLDRFVEVFKEAAEQQGTGPTVELGGAAPEDIEAAIGALGRELEQRGVGLRIVAVAGGYRMENDTRCGPWLRQFLEKGKPNRLSHPALETLAIIAYRQPVIRSEIEAVRGVAVDQIVRNLLDLQLVRAVGRSDLPGRPWMFGTTQRFLEHFGLRSLDDLPGVDELRRMESRQQAAKPASTPAHEGAEAAAVDDPDPASASEAATEDAAGLEPPSTATVPVEPGTPDAEPRTRNPEP